MFLRGLRKRAVSAAVSAALAFSLVTVLPVPAANEADTVTINMGKEYQTIKGFGGMNCPDWGVDLTDAQVQKAFGNGADELGFTVCRIFVSDNANGWNKQLRVAKKAQSLGALVFASPWNPPTSMCETFSKQNDADAKRLKKSAYGDYAKHLNDFVTYVTNNGVDLYSISIQNEPDWGFDWTWWTEDECVDFLANYADKINCRVMSPESFSYRKSYYDKILANPQAYANTDLFGTHFYGTSRQNMDYPKLESCGKEIFMTEVYTDSKSDADVWPLALDVAENVHNGLAIGNMNAYVWWYLRRSYGPLKEDGNISKRGYCMAQYSKFVRPGDVRIDATESPSNQVYVSAYKNKNNQVTIVAVNKSTSGYAQNFSLGSAEIADIDRWRTSGSENLAVTENLEYSGSSFYAQLPAQSVSTFVVTLVGGTVTQPTEPTVLNGTRIKNLVVSDTENASDWSIQNGFKDGVAIYGDRDITVQNVPAHLVDAEYVRTACDSKLVTTDEATFTAGQDSSIYIVMDDRMTNPAPAWLSGWTKTAFTMQSSNGVTFEIYKKNVKSGDSITLGTNGGSGNSANYIVLATKQQDEPVVTQSIRGDVNADGSIDARDLTLAKRLLSAKQYAVNADVNADGKVDKTDAELLMEYLLGKIKEFPKAVPVVDNAKMEQIFSGVTVGKSYKAANEGNSLITQYFGADPGVMAYNDRVYIYMTDDHLEYKNGAVSDNTYSQIKCLRCISSADLVNWTDHGLIPVAGQNGIAKWAGCSWAPTACHKIINGKEKFFLYFANNANGIGVLTADSPTGPWSDPNGKALISRSTPTCNTVAWVFDPAVLVDDDGTGYLYFGGGRHDGGDVSNPGTGRVVKLNPDMTSLAGDPVRFDIPYLFEDSGINKIGGKYVYSYCSNWSTGGNNLGMTSAAIEYMVSDNPMGPFIYGGEVFKNIGTFFGTVGNNHHTIFEFKNQYYLAYHSQKLQDLMGLKGGYRSTHLDVLPMNGSLPGQVKGTMTGVPQVGTLNPYETVRAATIWRQSGIEISGSGSTQVTGITSGDWFAVKGADFSRGASQVTMKIASSTGGAVKICTGSENGTVVGYVEVPASGTNYTELTAPVSGLSGKQDVYFIFSGAMSVESWSFT